MYIVCVAHITAKKRVRYIGLNLTHNPQAYSSDGNDRGNIINFANSKLNETNLKPHKDGIESIERKGKITMKNNKNKQKKKIRTRRPEQQQRRIDIFDRVSIRMIANKLQLIQLDKTSLVI